MWTKIKEKAWAIIAVVVFLYLIKGTFDETFRIRMTNRYGLNRIDTIFIERERIDSIQVIIEKIYRDTTILIRTKNEEIEKVFNNTISDNVSTFYMLCSKEY